MIKNSDKADFIIPLKKAGSLAAAADVDAAVVPFASHLVAVLARNGTAGVDGTGTPTQDVLIDVNKNGTTLISTKLTWTHTALGRAPSSYGSFASLLPPAFAKGDTVSFDVDQVLNGDTPTQPTNFGVDLVFRRRGSLPAAVLTDSVILEGSE